MKYIVCACFFLMTFPSKSIEGNDFLLATYNSPPYQYIKNDQVVGESVNTIQCIFSKLNQAVEFNIYPMQRALKQLTYNNLDGVFPVYISDKNNSQYSFPISIEKWHWLSNFPINHTSFQNKNYRIGALNGSATYDWLIKNNYRVNTKLTTEEQLMSMFKAGRLDAIIVDGEDKYQDFEFYQPKKSLEHYLQFIKFTPHHLLFSKDAVDRDPNLISNFNEQIATCNPVSLKLTPNEKQILSVHINNYRVRLMDFFTTRPQLRKLTEQLPNVASEALDARWIKEVNAEKGDLFELITQSQLSDFLADIQRNSYGLITEILVMDTEGYIIGLSQPSSDLYQGDEAKFLQTFPHGANTVYVSDIEYDSSTNTYQSQVSFTLSDPITPVGVITIGFDIEKVLAK